MLLESAELTLGPNQSLESQHSCLDSGASVGTPQSTECSPVRDRCGSIVDAKREKAKHAPLFTTRFKISVIVVMVFFGVCIAALVGLCLLFEHHDMPSGQTVTFFSEFMGFFNYSLLRRNNQRRILVEIFGIIIGLSICFPGWVNGAVWFSYTDHSEALLMDIGSCMSLGLGLAWLLRWMMSLKPYWFAVWRYKEDYSDMAGKLKTGDVVLCSSTALGGQMIKLVTASNYSHIALIVKDPSEEVLKHYYLDETERDPNGVYIWEATPLFLDKHNTKEADGKPKRTYLRDLSKEREKQNDMRDGGVQLNPLKNWLAGYRMWEGSKSVVTVRRLVGAFEGKENAYRCDFATKLEPLMLNKELSRATYETSPFRCTGGVLGWNTHWTTKKAFCSELVGMALQELNLMKDKAEEESWETIAEQCLHWEAVVEPSNLTPEDFAKDVPLLKKGVFLGPPIRLKISEEDVDKLTLFHAKISLSASKSQEGADAEEEYTDSQAPIHKAECERMEQELVDRETRWAVKEKQEKHTHAVLRERLDRRKTQVARHTRGWFHGPSEPTLKSNDQSACYPVTSAHVNINLNRGDSVEPVSNPQNGDELIIPVAPLRTNPPQMT